MLSDHIKVSITIFGIKLKESYVNQNKARGSEDDGLVGPYSQCRDLIRA